MYSNQDSDLFDISAIKSYLAFIKSNQRIHKDVFAVKFSLNNDQLQQVLSWLSDKGFIQIIDYNIIFLGIDENLLGFSELSIEHLLIIGYLTLKQLTTIDELSQVLQLVGSDIESILSDAVLRDQIDIKIGLDITKKYGTRITVKVNSKPTINHDFLSHQLEDKTAAMPSVEQLIYQTLDEYFQVNFLVLAGIIHLKRTLMNTEELISIFQPSTNPAIEEILDYSYLMKLLSVLALQTNYNLQMHPDGSISGKILGIPKSQISNITIPGYEEIEIHAILGFIRETSKFSIQTFSQYFTQTFFQAPNQELLAILAVLCSIGKIDGYIDADGLFIVSVIPKGQDITILSFEEKVFLGVLSADKTPNLQNIASLLNLKYDEVKRMYLKLSGKGKLSAQITRNKDLILSNIPSIPPQTQVLHLSDQYQMVLGYLLSQKDVNCKKLPSLFKQLDCKQFLIISYFLVGSGLMTMLVSKNNINDVQRVNSTIYDTRKKLPTKLRDLINLLTTSPVEVIAISELAIKLNLNQNEVTGYLYQIIALGYFSNAKIQNNQFYPNGSYEGYSTVISCLHCSSQNLIEDEYCTNCQKEIELCIICLNPLSLGEILFYCPKCKKIGHESHFVSWLTIKQICPICRIDLTREELIKYQKG